MKRQTCRSGSRAAFTLLEVLMVVAIIGLLAAFVVPNLFGARDRAKVQLTQALVSSGLNGALNLYRTNMERYPREDDGGLRALLEPPSDEEQAKRWGKEPYVKPEDLKDPWGNEYRYEFPGKYNTNGYDLWSLGPDGEDGTDDDITNWKRE